MSQPQRGNLQQLPRENRFKLPEYLEMAEVNALIAAAPNMISLAVELGAAAQYEMNTYGW